MQQKRANVNEGAVAHGLNFTPIGWSASQREGKKLAIFI